ncbi:MAG: hypothetical protein HYS13_11945 [Planctomycetia bacterium]|nr:hypothetical protein [Planctomycetia bacterium]
MTRRRLPHWYVPGAAHFVTFRLADTLPLAIIERLERRREEMLRRRPAAGISQSEHRARVHNLLFAEYDNFLDKPSRVEWLRDARVAAKMRTSLYFHHSGLYYLLAYCVMPNHVHVLLQPIEPAGTSQREFTDQPVGEFGDSKSRLAKIMHSLKSYTAHEANRILRRSGSFWQPESYDHRVRDEDELERIVHYIRANPVKAGLVRRPQDWYFCSCQDRFLTDGDDSGWLDWSGAK